MNKSRSSFDEVKGLILDLAKEHPFYAAIGAGVGVGLAYALPKLGQRLENVGKYAVDKIAERLPAATTQYTLNEKVAVEVSATELTDDSKAA